MTSPGFPELFVSLTLQCSLVLLVAWILARRAVSSAAADRIWAHAHVLILVLCLVGGFLPHFRILQPDSVLIMLGQIAATSWFQIFFRTIGSPGLRASSYSASGQWYLWSERISSFNAAEPLC